MKNFQVEIQFYTPDSVPLARGCFSVPAVDEGNAVEIILNKLIDSGYNTNELSLISVKEL